MAVQLDMVLYAGRRYRVVAPRAEQKTELLRRLRAAAPIAVVAPRGGLIGNLKVWENLLLPVSYGGAADPARLERRAESFFGALGVARERFVELCGLLPERLSEFERRLVAFVRGLLAEPEIMLYDGLFDGLARHEVQKAVRFDALYRRHYPFRTALYVDAHDLAVPGLEDHPLIQI